MTSTAATTTDVLVLHESDDVAVAASGLAAGADIAAGAAGSVRVAGPVPAGHKIALRAVAAGEPVRKYGQVIGFASQPIAAGEHVHTHNLVFGEFERKAPPPPAAAGAVGGSAREMLTFEGYRRSDGRAGTRNYVAVVSTVNCSATVAKRIARRFEASGELADYPDVAGVVALTHSTGCGMQPGGEGMDVLRRTLAGYLDHPNVGGVLVLGLGCEDNQVAALTGGARTRPDLPVLTATIQELGGSAAAVADGVARLRELLAIAGQARRTDCPVSDLVLGTNCGGSDAYSGLTANPALGAAVDLLAAHGGTGILAETPEIYGAEHLLAARAATPQVAADLDARIAWWRAYTSRHGGSMDNNPSPGNKDGGLTTILEKSLGAVAKGGTTPLKQVIGYAERPSERGLVFMDTPGYDPVSVTGIVAGGANLVCFTTGRGSVFGCKPVPSLKLATTTGLYQRMTADMDIDCGVILDGVPVATVGAAIFRELIAVASGKATKSEEQDFGDEEFVPWQLGAVM
ncbi:MAG TPA: altronate dehydratase family protein [Streptosporangiaceae bacterium]